MTVRRYPGGLRDDEAAALAAEYAEVGSYSELSRRHGRDREWAHRHLKRHGYEPDPNGPGLIKRGGDSSPPPASAQGEPNPQARPEPPSCFEANKYPYSSHDAEKQDGISPADEDKKHGVAKGNGPNLSLRDRMRAALDAGLRLLPGPDAPKPMLPIHSEFHHKETLRFKETHEDSGPVVILSDLHFPDHDKRAWGCVLEALAIIRPSVVVCAGDMLEVESANGHTAKRKGGDRRHDDLVAALQQEAASALREILRPLTEACGAAERHWLHGNHEMRAERALAKYGLDQMWQIGNLLKLSELGWQVDERPYGRLDKLGWLIQHGDEPCPSGSGVYAARWRALTYQRNVIFGHLHAYSANTVASAAGPVTAIGNPCLCDIERAREWAGTSRNRWTHGFTILRPTGDGGVAAVESVPIVRGRCWVNGRLVRG